MINKAESKKPSKTLWKDALRSAVMQSDPDRLRVIAEKLLNKASEGDIQAIKELGDRLDGKSSQQFIIAGDPENPLQVIERRIVK